MCEWTGGLCPVEGRSANRVGAALPTRFVRFARLPDASPEGGEERSIAAGVPGASMFDPEANVIVASWLLYKTPQGTGHWYPSEACWSN